MDKTFALFAIDHTIIATVQILKSQETDQLRIRGLLLFQILHQMTKSQVTVSTQTPQTPPHPIFVHVWLLQQEKMPSKTFLLPQSLPRIKKTGFTANGVANSLKKTIEFPETIKQGQYGTCGAAMMEKQLAMYNPFRFRECIESLISTSQYPYWNLELPAECGII